MITPSFSLTATERVLPKLALDFTTGTLDPRITFTRSSTATFTGSNGLIQSAAINAPRFDYNPTTLASLGLLIEEQRTNLFTYSDDFSNAIWGKSANSTLTSNTVVAPDGATTGDTFTRTATSSFECMMRRTTTQTVSTTFTLSIYAKLGTVGNQLYFRNIAVDGSTSTALVKFNLSTGVVDLTLGSIYAGKAFMTNAGNGWYRCVITGTTPSTIANNLIDIGCTSSGTLGGTAGDFLYIWGAQLETGAFATSYIPTVASQVTRTADIATMTGTNFSDWYSAGAGSAVIRVLPSTVSNTRPALQFDDATANEVITLRGSTTNPELVIVDGGAPQTQIDAGTIAANTVYSLGAAWSTNNCAAAVNGGTAVTDATATIPTVTQARLGSDGTNYLNGQIQTLRYWPQRVIDTEIQSFSK